MKLCKDCKHQRHWDCYRRYTDARRQCVDVDVVTGSPGMSGFSNLPPTCRSERNSIWPWKCGKSGRFFELKS